ncbi:MAG TPA: NADPH-dependent F420 reductase [Candidatus Limnocylindria bacterium]|jgi:predicted dinucleotide-binding enzyme|nr:NADPH-dependent F420 reductase [Candidatus Limnocylindria bacterium]
MRVAVIGVGNIGSALASSLTDAGHDVVVAASNAEKAQQAAAGLECEPAPSPREAADGADAVVLAIPFPATEEVAGEIRDEVAGKPVIDVTNSQAVVETGTSNAEAIQGWLPEAHVVKAFNTVFASQLSKARDERAVDGRTLDGFIAGDDAEAKATVETIVRDAGLEPLDIGGLRMARALEGMAWTNISLNMAKGWPWTSAWKLVR